MQAGCGPEQGGIWVTTAHTMDRAKADQIEKVRRDLKNLPLGIAKTMLVNTGKFTREELDAMTTWQIIDLVKAQAAEERAAAEAASTQS